MKFSWHAFSSLSTALLLVSRQRKSVWPFCLWDDKCSYWGRCHEVSSDMSYKQRRVLAVWTSVNNFYISCASLLLLFPTILLRSLFHLLSLAFILAQGLLLRNWLGLGFHLWNKSTLCKDHCSLLPMLVAPTSLPPPAYKASLWVATESAEQRHLCYSYP